MFVFGMCCVCVYVEAAVRAEGEGVAVAEAAVVAIRDWRPGRRRRSSSGDRRWRHSGGMSVLVCVC